MQLGALTCLASELHNYSQTVLLLLDNIPKFEAPCLLLVLATVAGTGTVKGLTSEQMQELDCHVILGNTYHLANRPGGETVAALGGLHGFSNWPRGMLTDSGGFQMVSLLHLADITEEGTLCKGRVLSMLGCWRIVHLHLSPEIVGSRVRRECRLAVPTWEQACPRLSVTRQPSASMLYFWSYVPDRSA